MKIRETMRKEKNETCFIHHHKVCACVSVAYVRTTTKSKGDVVKEIA